MIRTEVRRELARLIAGDGTTGNVAVSAFYPGDKHQQTEMIFGDRTNGLVTFPYGMAPPRLQRDRFAVVFVVRIDARAGIDEAMVRCEELSNIVAGILASESLLGFAVDGEEVTDTNPDGEGIQVDTREGETKTGGALALAEITVPIETQTTNTEG